MIDRPPHRCKFFPPRHPITKENFSTWKEWKKWGQRCSFYMWMCLVDSRFQRERGGWVDQFVRKRPTVLVMTPYLRLNDRPDPSKKNERRWALFSDNAWTMLSRYLCH